MLGIVQDRVVTSGQERWCERDIIEFAGACFGCQIHLESCGGQHFVWMQGLHEEYACLVAAGIDGTIEAGNCDKGFTGKSIRHSFLLSFLFFAIHIDDTAGDRRDNASYRTVPTSPNFFLFTIAGTSSPPFPRYRRSAAGRAVR